MTLVEQQGGKLIVHSAMTVDTASALLDASLPLLTSGQALELDLSAVGDADSSAISLMLEWLRVANSRQVSLKYSGLPPSIVSLASLYGVLEMIPQSTH
ncbi:MAG: lipid asymmetry maintenance protein MlaB [Methylophilaceae bacterium]